MDLLITVKWTHPIQETKRVEYEFPDSKYLSALVDLYFIHSNPFLPLLHRHTFEKAIDNGLHHQETQFAATVILVCAIGVRFSQDPRATTLPYDHPDAPGWTWFLQAQKIYHNLLCKPSLHTVQAYGVSFTSTLQRLL